MTISLKTQVVREFCSSETELHRNHFLCPNYKRPKLFSQTIPVIPHVIDMSVTRSPAISCHKYLVEENCYLIVSNEDNAHAHNKNSYCRLWTVT